MKGKTREGLVYGLAAYGLWGVVPLYFRLLKDDVPILEILAQRIVWSVVFLAAILTFTRRWGEVARCFRTRSLFLPLMVSSLLVAANWIVYIYSVMVDKIVEASLGYYILPLTSVMIGMAVFRERLRLWQWVALAAASIGVAQMTLNGGDVPWIAFTLAVSFGIYGAIRKQVPVDGLTGLAVETFLLAPVSLAYLAWVAQQGTLAAVPDRWDLILILAAGGIITATPLLCFGQAARRLPLSTMGFLQYVSPTLQLLIAVFCFGEGAPAGGWESFILIWVALAIFSLDSLALYRRTERARTQAALQPEVCEM